MTWPVLTLANICRVTATRKSGAILHPSKTGEKITDGFMVDKAGPMGRKPDGGFALRQAVGSGRIIVGINQTVMSQCGFLQT